MDTHPIVMPVRFAGGGLAMQTTTSRFGLLGAFVRSLVSPKLRTEVLLVFTLPAGDQVEVHGLCVEQVPPGTPRRDAGFAVKFTSMAPLGKNHIEELVRTLEAQPKVPTPTPPHARPRAFPRLRTRLQVGWASPREFLVAYSENISRGGIFVSTQSPPDLGESVELLLELPDEKPPARTQAEVVQRITVAESALSGRQPGAGLQFVGADDEFRQRLDDCLEHLLTKAE